MKTVQQQDQEKRAASKAKRSHIREALKAAMKAAELEWDGHQVNGQFLDISIDEDTKGGMTWSMYHRGTGKFRIKVGSYGEVKQFPEPKKGFDYEKITKHITARLQRRKDSEVLEKARRNKSASNQSIADRVNAQTGCQNWQGTRATVGRTGSLMVEGSLFALLSITAASNK